MQHDFCALFIESYHHRHSFSIEAHYCSDMFAARSYRRREILLGMPGLHLHVFLVDTWHSSMLVPRLLSCLTTASIGYGLSMYCSQVILGSMAAGDGTFDKDSDFAATINDGAWSVPLSTILNNTGDVLYVVPAARSAFPAISPSPKPSHSEDAQPTYWRHVQALKSTQKDTKTCASHPSCRAS